MSNTIFKMSLALPSAIAIGTPVKGKFTLTNTSKKDQRVLTWHTPLEGLKGPHCFTVLYKGIPVKYDGKIALHAPSPSDTDYITVKAGETVSAEIDFSAAYHFYNAGSYTISIICTLRTAGSDAPAAVEVSSGATFELTAGALAAIPTEGMQHRASARPLTSAEEEVSGAAAPTIVNGNSTQQAALLQAWDTAYLFQARAISALSGDTFDTVFASTFSATATAANKAQASGYYSQMQQSTGANTFTLTILPQDSGNVIAYTYLNSTSIFFYPVYFTLAAQQGDFSMAAVMVHELTHSVCSIPDCSDAIACSYTLGYFSGRVYYSYTLTLPEGTISVRNKIFKGSQTEAIWSPCNPNEVGGWLQGDQLAVICSFNLNPPITPQPSASEYCGLCVGACSDQDTNGIATLISEAQGIYVPNPGQLLGVNSLNQVTTNTTPVASNIFYSADMTAGTFPLTPATRGTLSNYIYQWSLTYNGDNTIVPSGSNVEVVFGYGDPMWSEVDS
jgi:peptidyl-Lys metalloendopeptidase